MYSLPIVKGWAFTAGEKARVMVPLSGSRPLSLLSSFEHPPKKKEMISRKREA